MRDIPELRLLRDRARVDPMWVIRRMTILDMDGRRVRMGTVIRPEQERIVETLLTTQRTLILKSRQIGATTIVTAFMTWLSLFGYDGVYNWLSMCHEQDSQFRVNAFLRDFILGLPRVLSPGLGLRGVKKLSVPYHRGSRDAPPIGLTATGGPVEPMFVQVVAGGRGGGRSFTFSGYHGTEAAFWPKGSAAASTKKGADENAFASVQATLNLAQNPWGRLVLESTADGPTGLFARLWRENQGNPEWASLFYPWHQFDRYRLPGAVLEEVTDEEERLRRVFDVDDEQLAWRRQKLTTDGYSLQRFMREYPMTPMEPFLAATDFWFNTMHLVELESLIPAWRHNQKADLLIFEEPDPTTKYFLGVDTAGGTGFTDDNDWAVIQVVDEHLRQVARWHSKTTDPYGQAEKALLLSARYNSSPIAVERNKYGGAVLLRLHTLGATVWYDRDGKPGWLATDVSKRDVYSSARSYIDGGHVDLNDPMTLTELAAIRELDNGRIEGDGEHDDHADALVIALYAARGTYRSDTQLSRAQRIAKERERLHRKIGTAR